jgi:hypothetical protein
MPAKDYFYYVDTNDACTNGNFQLSTLGKPNYAKICAWKASLPDAVYGCDAKSGVCWTSPQPCTLPPNIGNSSLGNGLQSCTRSSSTRWCCRAYPGERCDITLTEPYVCWANDLDDDNPFRQIEGDVARNPESASSILSSMNLTISSPTALPVITTGFLTASANNSDTTSISDPGTTLISNQEKKPVLSSGAVAGVVIGAIVFLGLHILGAVLILRYRKRKYTTPEPLDTPSEVLAEKISANELSDAAAMYELESSTCAEFSGNQRHELADSTCAELPGDQQHELPP